jgi:heterodisulfide reductase subunit B2
MRYTHFPGCSLESTGIGHNMSLRAVCQALGIEIEELEDWNCCGSPAYFDIDEMASLCLAGRNLALAEKHGSELVASCSACYLNLRKANQDITHEPGIRRRINAALSTGGLKYDGNVRVRHLTEVLLNDAMLKAISSKVTRPLSGLRVAAYYGCYLARPDAGLPDKGLVGPLERLLTILGAIPTSFPLMNACCGGTLIASEEKIALSLMNKLFRSATDHGARLMVAACPLCHLNMDAFQSKSNQLYGTAYHLPVLFFTQLIGFALGIDRETLGINRNIVSADAVLAAFC